jgi:hypothetical protein
MNTRKKIASRPITLYFLEVLNSIKLFHWNTSSFAAHKASDELHEKLSEHVDKFVEILLRDKRIEFFKVNMPVYNLSKPNFTRYLSKFESYILSLNLDNDLANIRDEMSADIHQFFYLLKLK